MTEARIVVVTPWYPTPDHEFAGIFVKDAVLTLAETGPLPLVVHVNNIAPEMAQPPQRTTVDGIDVLRIDVPTAATTSRQEMGRRQREALRAHALDEIHAADTVHAHVGIPAAWAVSGLLRESQRLVVTEHASYLRRELSHDAGRQMYRAVMDRAAAVLAVSDGEAGRIRRAFPEYRHKAVSWGNPVREPERSTPHSVSATLDHWLFVGRLAERKGVLELIEAFAAWHAERPSATLTVVGGGPEADAMRDLAHELEVLDAVRFEGPQPSTRVGSYFAEADVLVHLSHVETFGLTVLEALMAELPVLVTRCGGPQETTATAQVAGLVRTIKVQSPPERVVEAMLELETTSVGADRAAIREEVVERFGTQNFGSRLRRVLNGGPAWDPRPAHRPHLLAVARSSKGHKRLARLSVDVLRTQTGLTVLSPSTGSITGLDPRISIIDVGRTVARHPLHLPERVLVFAVPQRILKGVRGVLGLARRAGAPASLVTRAEALTEGVERKHRRLAHGIRHRVLERFLYSYLDPWLLADRWQEILESQVDFADVDALVVTDNDTRPLLWRLARKYPDIPIIGIPDVRALESMTRRLP